MNLDNIIRNMEAKLLRQEQVAQETRDHIELLKQQRREREDKDQQKLPLTQGSKK